MDVRDLTLRWWLFLPLLGWFGIPLMGCVSAPQPKRPGTTPLVVWEIELRGNKRLSQSNILAGMETATTGLIARFTRLRALGQYSVYDKTILAADIRRLRTLYRYYGFYRSQIDEAPESPVILTERTGYRPYKRVRVILNIKEGPQAELVSIAEINWNLGALPKDYVHRKLRQMKKWDGRGNAPVPDAATEKEIQETFKQEILRGFSIQKGQFFSTPNYQAMKGAIIQRLQDASFALAEMRGEVIIEKETLLPDPPKTAKNKKDAPKKETEKKDSQPPTRSATAAKMRLTILTGPSCRFGAIAVKPLPLMVDGKAVPPRVDYTLIRRYFKFKQGDTYKIQSIVSSQRALSGLSLFSAVDFKPDIPGVRKSQDKWRTLIRQARDIMEDKAKKKTIKEKERIEAKQLVQDWEDKLQGQAIKLSRDVDAQEKAKKQLAQITEEISDLTKEIAAAQALKETALKELNKQVEIPITLEIREDRFQLVKIGGGFVLDGQRNQVEASLGWTILNFLGGLRRLEIQLRPGWSFLPDILRRIDTGPDFTGSISFIQPFFLKEQGEIRVRLLSRYSQQIGDTDFWQVLPSVTVSYPLMISPRFGTILLSVSVNGEFADVQNPLTLQRENYLFGYLEQQLTWSLLDDPIKRTSGFEFKITLQQAAGSYAFAKFAPELSFYIPLFSIGNEKVILAGRMQYGVLFSTRLDGRPAPTSGEDPIADRVAEVIHRSPITQRFYLGGANSVRGWTARYLGPLACQVNSQALQSNYADAPNDNKDGVTDFRTRNSRPSAISGAGQIDKGQLCRIAAGQNALSRFADMARFQDALELNGRRGNYIPPGETLMQVVPMGGEQQLYGSLELRIPLSILVSSLGFVLFADVGVVQLERMFWDDARSAPPVDLLPSLSLGFGIRYHTVIGAIRLDVAFRVAPETDRYPLQRDWQFHFSIGEAF